MYTAVFIGVLLGICAFSLLLCCVIFWCEFYRRSERRWGGYRGKNGRWRSLGHVGLHKPRLTMQKQHQGIPISLEMESGEFFESYPLHPSSGPVDFFSDPLLLDSDRESLPGGQEPL
jgi:hypothetical protein